MCLLLHMLADLPAIPFYLMKMTQLYHAHQRKDAMITDQVVQASRLYEQLRECPDLQRMIDGIMELLS